MNEEASEACITPQDQPTNLDTTRLDTQIEEFPANSKDQTISTLEFIKEFKEETILIRIVEKHKFIDKLLNYLFCNPLLEISYGTEMDRETVELSLIVLDRLVIIDPEINTPVSYCLTRNTLLNIVHMLTELPLAQPSLLYQGCYIIRAISKNYDGNFIFDNLINNCSLNSFFANLCSNYLAINNMEEQNFEQVEDHHFIALESWCWQQVFYAIEEKNAASDKSQNLDYSVDINHIVEESIANVSNKTLGSVSREVSKDFIKDISICAQSFWGNTVITGVSRYLMRARVTTNSTNRILKSQAKELDVNTTGVNSSTKRMRLR